MRRGDYCGEFGGGEGYSRVLRCGRKSVLGNSQKVDDELTEYLLNLNWWNWDAEKIFRNM